MALAIVAGGLISVERGEHPAADAANRRTALLLALAAGVGFGFSFVCYGNTRDASEFWPVLSGRIGAVTRRAWWSRRCCAQHPARRARLASRRSPPALLDVVATTLLLVAIRDGLFATVAPVAALHPAFTVGHAWWYLRETAIDASRSPGLRSRSPGSRSSPSALSCTWQTPPCRRPLPITRPVRLAVVGLGQISELVLPTYLERDDVAIVGLCDHDDGALDALARRRAPTR